MLADLVIILILLTVIGFILYNFVWGFWTAFREPNHFETAFERVEYADGHSIYRAYVIYRGASLFGLIKWSEKNGVTAKWEKNDIKWASINQNGACSPFPTEELAHDAAARAILTHLEEKRRETIVKTEKL
jgi:hypothetical protein